MSGDQEKAQAFVTELHSTSDLDNFFKLCFAEEKQFNATLVVKALEAYKASHGKTPMTLRTYRFKHTNLHFDSKMKRRTRASLNITDLETDVYETTATNGLLTKPLSPALVKAVELLLKHSDASGTDEFTLYFGGRVNCFDSTTAFNQAIEYFETSELDLEVKLLSLFIEDSVKSKSLTQLLESANEVIFIDAEGGYETIARTMSWHFLVQFGLVEVLSLAKVQENVFKEGVSVISMTAEGRKIGDLCCKAIHFAVNIENEDKALEMTKFLLEEVKVDVNSLSMRTEDEDEEDSEHEDAGADHLKQAKYRVVETALHISIKRKSFKLFKLLIEYGANKNLPWVECPLNMFEYSSMKQIITENFNFTPSLEPKWQAEREYSFNYEKEYLLFISHPTDSRAITTIEELIEFYIEDEDQLNVFKSLL